MATELFKMAAVSFSLIISDTVSQLLGVNRDSRLEIKFDSVEDVNVS
jgi:hypothetical protein